MLGAPDGPDNKLVYGDTKNHDVVPPHKELTIRWEDSDLYTNYKAL